MKIHQLKSIFYFKKNHVTKYAMLKNLKNNFITKCWYNNKIYLKTKLLVKRSPDYLKLLIHKASATLM